MKRAAAKARGKTQQKSARDKVFEVAAELFYSRGVRDVGVEEIVKRADVAKISLYRHFASKDDLVVAYLEARRDAFLASWDQAFDGFRADPCAELGAIMTHVAERTTEEGYRGCPFINFSAEFPDPAHPGRRVARFTKAALRQRFLRIAESAGAAQPRVLADGLLLLVEGAYAISQTLGGGDDGAGHALVAASEMLIQAQLGAKTR